MDEGSNSGDEWRGGQMRGVPMGAVPRKFEELDDQHQAAFRKIVGQLETIRLGLKDERRRREGSRVDARGNSSRLAAQIAFVPKYKPNQVLMIDGARGTGKTTLFLSIIQQNEK